MDAALEAAVRAERAELESAAQHEAEIRQAQSQGQPQGPTLRLGPLHPEQADTWAEHCEYCFKDKQPFPPPRHHFADHLSADPTADLGGVALLQTWLDLNAERRAEQDKAKKERKEEEKKDEQKNEESSASASSAASSLPVVRSSKRIIAATGRILVRRQYINGAKVTFGGIGEVSTRQGYRGNGYAELVLDRLQQYCKLTRLQSVQLHASGEMIPFYAARGWRSIEQWMGSKADMEVEGCAYLDERSEAHGSYTIRSMTPSQFLSPDFLPQWRTMYELHSSQFNGPVSRGEEYWERWMRRDLESSRGSRWQYPIEIFAAYEEWDGSEPAPNPPSPIRMVAYLLVQRQRNPEEHRILSHKELKDRVEVKRDRTYEVVEYAALPGTPASKGWLTDRDADGSSSSTTATSEEDKQKKADDGGRSLFVSLVSYALRHLRHKFHEIDPDAAKSAVFSVRFPLPLIAKFQPPLAGVKQEVDKGWMTKPIPLNMSAREFLEFQREVEQSRKRSHHARAFDEEQSIEEEPLTSIHAAAPIQVHHESEQLNETSAQEYDDKLRLDTKNKFVFWGMDAY